MLWIIFAILSYFLLAAVSLIDKIILSGPIKTPMIYAFLTGIFGGLGALILLPFSNFFSLAVPVIFFGLFSGAIWIFAIFFLYQALKKYDASTIIPAIGGLLPLFTLLLGLFFYAGKENSDQNLFFNFWQIVSFVLMVSGSVLISLNLEKEKKITKGTFILSAFSAFLFANGFFLAKIVYLETSFLSGLALRLSGGFLASLLFLLSKGLREKIFFSRKKDAIKTPKTIALFLAGQLMGGAAGIFQNLSVYFVPLALLSFVNALEGIRYAFLLAFMIVFSFKFPHILSEKISKRILLKKISATILISLGLLIFAVKSPSL